jgi:hypothetical protein
MQCERCGRPVSVRFFIPVTNPLKRMLNSVGENLREGQWICEECLKQSR